MDAPDVPDATDATDARSPRRPSVPALFATLLAGLLTAGCSAGGGADGPAEPALGPVAVNPSTATLALPLDAYEDTDEEKSRLAAAQQRLAVDCMARFGFAYAPPPAPARPARTDRHRHLFGLADPAEAAAYGYDKDAGRPPRERPARPVLSDSARTVLYGERPGAQGGQPGPDPRSEEEAATADSGITVGGRRVPAGGCLRESYRKLYAPKKDSVDLLFAFGLASEAHTRAQRDSRVVAVVAEWSACMARAGHRGVDSPYEVTARLGLDAEPGGAKAVAVAVRDVACKREVNLVGVWAAVEAAYQQRLLEAQAETLAAYRTQRTTRLRLAATLL
ncbi:hypothetical protein LG634_30090 [Streptomyces bambusae]|uniref:hypothetical protein n=1 Tax=Streptomyces bambusae TaxID=1550616 RepID=UPI001CFCFAC1|nr:hypothetical protein [Streptomyces bambusae]MCB5169051.1 hypothetical protein [Streptomyces bambusae]